MTTFLIVLGITLAAIMVLYMAARIISGQTLLRSEIIQRTEIEADHYYFLPGFSMSIQATALVEITKSEDDKTIEGASLLQLTLDPTISIVPDTEELVRVKYYGDWFSNDEISIVTSANALLENVSTSVEDRIGPIISQFTAAPASFLTGLRQLEALRKPVRKEQVIKRITEIREFSRTFTVSCKELHGKTIAKEWVLVIPGLRKGARKVVDASFTITNKGKEWRAKKGLQFDGLLTRPLVEQQWAVQVSNKPGLTLFSATVPDLSTIIKVPVRRGYFIKKQQLPAFSNGLLLSNTINKPSEIEAFASIPINIFKAIFSIPAQLLQFRIIRNKQETEYEKSALELVKARAATREAQAGKSIEKLTNEVNALKEKLKTTGEQAPLQRQPQEELEEPVPELGKLPAEPVQKRSSLVQGETIRAEIAAAQAAAIELPKDCFWNKQLPNNWDDYNNKINGQKNCIPAAAAHTITCWTSNAQPEIVRFPQTTIDEVYGREAEIDPDTGLPDGCILSSFLDGWKEAGVGNHTIIDYRALTDQDEEEMKLAVFLFGGCIAGFKMPQTAQKQSTKWEVVAGTPALSAAPDSWGGHAVAVIGYDEQGLLIVSWGRVIEVTWEFYKKYNDESYTMLSADWLINGQHSPSKTDLASLHQALNDFNS